MLYDDLKAKLIAKLKSPGYEDHKFSMDRRELIRLGLIAGGGALVPFSLFERVLAQTTSKVNTPFLVFDLAGGAAMAGNFLVGKQGGPEDLFENYRRHGWNPRASGALDHTFGLPMSKKSSKMLEGLKQTLPKEIAENEGQTMFKMASFCHFSLDDTNTNRSSAITMVSRAGLQGSLVKGSIGQAATNSGGNSDVYLQDARFKPKSVGSSKDILNLTSFGKEFEDLDGSQRRVIFEGLKKAAGKNSQLRDLYEDLSHLGVIQPKMDVLQSAEMRNLYQINSPTDGGTVQAAIVYNVLNGYTGPGVITIGNCDYHDNTGTTGDAKDLEIGQAIGRAIQAAYILKKPLFIQIITDGAVYAQESNNFERRWKGDSNQSSLSVLGYFHPTRAVQLKKQQVGYYTDTGLVEMKTSVGPGPERMALGTLINYLNLHGAVGQFESVADTRLQPNEIDELLVFG